MTINDFFGKTYNANKMEKLIGIYFQDVRPRIYCNDGFNMSVQASESAYCVPRITGDINYHRAEIGYPSEEEPLINDYAESEDYTNTVYGYVPCELIDEVIAKHNGIDEEKTFSKVGVEKGEYKIATK